MHNIQARWFVIQFKPHKEVKACQELQKQGYEVYLPTIEVENVLEINNHFFRYLFIQLNQTNSNWMPLRSTRGVSNLPKKDCFLPGQFVQIIAGLFRGMQGIFEKLVKAKDGQERAIILSEILGKT